MKPDRFQYPHSAKGEKQPTAKLTLSGKGCAQQTASLHCSKPQLFRLPLYPDEDDSLLSLSLDFLVPNQLWVRPCLLPTDESCCTRQGGFSLFLHFHNVSLLFTFPLLSSWPQFRTACKHTFNLIDLMVRKKTRVPLPSTSLRILH